MKLQATDLISYCKNMEKMTNNRFVIIPTYSDYHYWTLEIKDTEELTQETLVSWLTTREAYEALRGIYNTYRFFNSYSTTKWN